MLAYYNVPVIEFPGIVVGNVLGSGLHGQFEHLVEIAVVEHPNPTHRNGIAAHDPGCCCRVESSDQLFHI